MLTIARNHRPSLLALCLPLVAAAAPAQDWPHWRGPNYDGSTRAEGLPTDFDRQKRVRWATELPGPAACTPIVVGDRVFLTSVDDERRRLVAMCLDRRDGKVRWTEATTEAGAPLGKDNRSNFASPSPATDGERVVFFFGNGDLIAFDLEGGELWRRNLQEDYGRFAFLWTFSASPTIWEGKVFVPVLQRDVPVSRGGFGRGRRGGRRAAGGDEAPPDPIESFVLAIDPATGETIYKQPRPSPARMESREAYTTMIPFVGEGGRKEILVAGGDVLTAHDPVTGEELWRWGTWNAGHRQRSWRLVPSVVIGGSVAVVCAPKRDPVYAVHLGGKGELGEAALAWKSEGRRNPVSSDVPTPAFYEGHLYVLSDVRRALSKVDPKDGEVRWTIDMPGDYLWRASPTAADGKIWCMNHNGEVVVVDAGDGEIVHRVAMGREDDDLIRSSIVVAHGDLFIRTNDRLFCIGE